MLPTIPQSCNVCNAPGDAVPAFTGTPSTPCLGRAHWATQHRGRVRPFGTLPPTTSAKSVCVGRLPFCGNIQVQNRDTISKRYKAIKRLNPSQGTYPPVPDCHATISASERQLVRTLPSEPDPPVMRHVEIARLALFPQHLPLPQSRIVPCGRSGFWASPPAGAIRTPASAASIAQRRELPRVGPPTGV